jgi:hypothetical protein
VDSVPGSHSTTKGHQRYAKDFCELLAAHMRKLFPVRPLSAPKVNGAGNKPRSRARGTGAVRIKRREAAIK